MTLKAQEIYGMAAVKISRAAAERAIALTRSNSRSTWEAILRSSRREHSERSGERSTAHEIAEE
jgi:hypothetical protein